jgi:hypothetical protein
MQLAGVGAAAECDDRRMLEEDDGVRDRALGHSPCQGALQVPGLLIRHETQIEKIGPALHACSLAAPTICS